MRHKALGVCSGTFHSDSQLRSRLSLRLFVCRTRVGMRQCCRLVHTTCNYNLNTDNLMPLPTDKACGASNDSCAQEMTWGGNCRNKFQTQLTFKKPTATRKFSSHPLREKKKKKTTPNCNKTRCSVQSLSRVQLFGTP